MQISNHHYHPHKTTFLLAIPNGITFCKKTKKKLKLVNINKTTGLVCQRFIRSNKISGYLVRTESNTNINLLTFKCVTYLYSEMQF